MMTTIQIIAVFFGLFMGYLTFVHFKRREFNTYQFVIWEILWIGFILITILPNRFNYITEQLGIARAFDLFAIFAFIIILSLTFHNYLLINKIEKKIEQKVRDQALKSCDKE